MNKNLCFFVVAILATLFTTSAQAEEVSRKAADLMANSSLLPTISKPKSFFLKGDRQILCSIKYFFIPDTLISRHSIDNNYL
ncbi:MAG: hypothetical protein HCA25_03585 [Dolichospermum sp. DET50]|nr:hypothetical protein [Dolichospermum sp. DET66]MBS3031384.1 hypothetical protein [Dolichospermum sp. DET67]MBS3036595.1 hypothetical protein [Dolichospermum sp. DET50]QSX68637.1 MAG: hypothetical protein EZY12_02750 [Dolichospermum sp. DET69]